MTMQDIREAVADIGQTSPEEAKPTPTQQSDVEVGHGPNEGIYFSTFLLLAALTVAEVLVTYIPGLKAPLLFGLMVAKVWLVVSFFMHLRYDRPILRWVFVIPILLGVIVSLALSPLVQ